VADSFIKIHSTQWNSPEGCVSVIQDYAPNGSLYNLTQSIGAVPESILKHLAKQVLRALNYMHEQNMTHSNICASQIVFDRKGRTKLSAGYGHILRYKQEVQSTLNQHFSLAQILSENLEINRQSLIKQKFSHLSSPASLMQQSYANSFSTEACIKELKKQDLFDLGIVLTLAATGGLEMINEEFLAKVPNI
jgi:serine/threonine protein kinase